ncbi:MAG: CHAD domain-containing protein [Enhydrobacter sp.]|nr:CHAD domain-containing protein [Enhydrobacter sp.]
MPPLAPDTPPDTALRQIVAECHADLLKHRIAVLAGRRATGIHQTRVALRRMRAALSLFRGAVHGPGEGRMLRALAAEAKWLASECGPARDLHVFVTETVQEVPPEVKRIASRLARLHYDRARTALSGARYNSFDGQLTAFVQAAPAASPTEASNRLDDFGRILLGKRHAKVLRRGQHLGSLDDEELHELRIAIKKLRYAATFLRPVFASEEAKAYIDATTRLQGALGAMNDRAVAAQMLDDIAVAARPTENVEPLLRQLAKQAASGDKRRRAKVQQAWKQFKEVQRFWQA